VKLKPKVAEEGGYNNNNNNNLWLDQKREGEAKPPPRNDQTKTVI
jgi:hypothetical protein